jgi:hypothetical protein
VYLSIIPYLIFAKVVLYASKRLFNLQININKHVLIGSFAAYLVYLLIFFIIPIVDLDFGVQDYFLFVFPLVIYQIYYSYVIIKAVRIKYFNN